MNNKLFLSRAHSTTNNKINFTKSQKSVTRNKSKTCYERPMTVPDQSTSRITQISQQYQGLVQQSLEKNYKISNLKPYSAYMSLDTVRAQIKKTPKLNNKINLKLEGSFNQKFTGLIKTAKSTRRSRRNRQCFIKSQIQDHHMDLVEDFDEEQKVDTRRKSILLKNLNKKIKKIHPQHAQCNDISDWFESTKHYVESQRNAMGVKRVYDEQMIRKPSKTNRKQPLSFFNKEDKQIYGTYSRSAKRTLVTCFEPRNIIPEKIQSKSIRRSKQASRVFYKSYMGSYSQRKKFLSHCKDSTTSIQNII